MTRQEILKMNGQTLCDWIHESVTFSNDDWRNFNRLRIWNLFACAWAARNYVINLQNGMEEKWIKELKALEFNWITKSTPLDWLKASAIVLAERNSNG